MIEPYERHLASMTLVYRADWGERVMAKLESLLGDLCAKRIEIHARAGYIDAIKGRLAASGAVVVEPLAGLTLGERLAWYRDAIVPFPDSAPVPAVADSPAVPVRPEAIHRLVQLLRDELSAMTPAEFLARGREGLDVPGLYSWWIDGTGADELSLGLGEVVEPGLIYAGLAGATWVRSGRRSRNTLWGRLAGMHLGSRHKFWIFRRSLGSILAAVRGTDAIDEEHLTAWMREHLRLVAVPVEDADVLDRLETDVLAQLDPPLNLAKMPKTTMRRRLSQLRCRYS
ncbi:MAG: hypothetical protein KDB20_14490 [Microthrixaceae bacterium]|nr:hypothetical protein [Microthrixaceae bacterium]